MRFKYVIGEIREEHLTTEMAVVGPEYIPHSTLKKLLFGAPISGGFFYIDTGDKKSVQKPKVVVYGESVGLNINSRVGIDEDIIARSVGLNE